MASEPGVANLMLGSQLVCKSMNRRETVASKLQQHQDQNNKCHQVSSNPQQQKTTNLTGKQSRVSGATSKQQATGNVKQPQPGANQKSPATSEPNNNNNHMKNSKDLEAQERKLKQQQNEPTATTTVHHSPTAINTTTTCQHNGTNANNNNISAPNSPQATSSSSSSRDESLAKTPTTTGATTAALFSAKEFEQLTREAQEMKIKTRKLQLEIDEKNEIINVLRDELETTKEQSDKFQRDNIQLLKDSKRVKFLQDENDFLQDKVDNVDKLELELKRLKERLAELDYLKLRIVELEEDKARSQAESAEFEKKWMRAEQGLTRVAELEAELDRWKSFSHDLESERNLIKSKLLESIDQEAKLNLTNKKVEDEVRRLRALIRSLEEEREEEQASNSLIMSVSDLKLMNQQQQQQMNHGDILLDSTTATNTVDSSIKFELDKQIEKGLNEENRNLKQKLEEQEAELSKLVKTNREICDELNGNKKLISDLRQDLACEKNLAAKLSKQLTSFERQIKNLDKQYFHSHDGDQAAATQPKQQQATNVASASSGGDTLKLDVMEIKQQLDDGKESSLLKSVTSSEKCERKEPKDALNLICNENNSSAERHEMNESGANKSYAFRLDNETTSSMQDNGGKNGSKLSAHTAEESATRGSMLVDNCNKLDESNDECTTGAKDGPEDKQDAGDLLRVASVEQTELVSSTGAGRSVVTNKSSATLEISNNKDKDEAHTKGGLSLSSSPISNNNATATGRKLSAQLELSAKTLSSSSLIDNQDEPLDKASSKSRKNVNSGNSSCGNNIEDADGFCNNNGNSVEAIQLLTSVSPSSNTLCSQSSSLSPSAPVTVGHDSGFQSINNDFNQNSQPSADASRSASSPARAAVVPATLAPTSSKTEAEVAALPKADAANAKQITPRSANRSTPIGSGGRQNVTTAPVERSAAVAASKMRPAAVRSQSTTPTQSQKDKVPSTIREANAFPGQPLTDGSQKQQKSFANNATSAKQASQSPTSTIADRNATSSKANAKCVHLIKQINDKSSDTSAKQSSAGMHAINYANHDRDDADEDENDEDEIVNKTSGQNRAKPRSNFVRNALPSRSVNYGHLARSSYLDRIRASVTATATTNTTSSFNEHQAQNIVLSQTEGGARRPFPARLNCMLDHQHLNSCFSAVDNRLPADYYLNHNLTASHHHPHHHHPHQSITEEGVRSSRQLNALIDPAVSHEHLMTPQQQQLILQQQQQQQQMAQRLMQNHTHGLPVDTTGLTEQQMAHLAHQHYYHHLEHMRQLHQMHHQHHLHLHHHRMYHKYQPQQQSEQLPTSAAGKASQSISSNHKHEDIMANQSSTQVRQREPVYTGGSQFYAPSMQLEQVYANMSANNNINQVNERQHHQHRARLVNGTTDQIKSTESNPSLRSSPNTQQHARLNGSAAAISHTNQQQHQIVSQCTLPQINEVNGLPTVQDTIGDHLNKSRSKSSLQPNITPEDAKAGGQHNGDLSSSNNASPTSNSSSPTSSASSNLSPSSASSSSSINSLTAASSVPLSRSALRHTTVDLSRRQFSIERELINSMPMTATLSRVGSCRMNGKSQDGDNYVVEDPYQVTMQRHQHQQLHNLSADSAQMRTPVVSSQPSMRTSKILNIGQQSTAVQTAAAVHQSATLQHNRSKHQQVPHHDQLAYRRTSLKATPAVGGSGLVDSKLASNLASIKLNDSLAFTSLRVPKGSSRPASGLNRSLNSQQQPVVSNGNGHHISSLTRPTGKQSASSSSSPEKQQLNSTANQTNDQANNNNSNKSSIWFEYGCV